MEFKDLNISKPILSALQEAGYEHPTPIQVQAFPVIRSGKDMIGIAQTGTGKTLAYLIPLLMKLHYAQGMHPRALVIVPTRELVVQVCESVELLTEFMDIRCIGIYGGTNIRTQQAAVYQGVDLLVATPGRFMDIYMNGLVRTGQVKTVVVDEAERLMDLGFMPQLRSILGVIPEKHQTLLFSATFSATVDELVNSSRPTSCVSRLPPRQPPLRTSPNGATTSPTLPPKSTSSACSSPTATPSAA